MKIILKETSWEGKREARKRKVINITFRIKEMLKKEVPTSYIFWDIIKFTDIFYKTKHGHLLKQTKPFLCLTKERKWTLRNNFCWNTIGKPTRLNVFPTLTSYSYITYLFSMFKNTKNYNFETLWKMVMGKTFNLTRV